MCQSENLVWGALAVAQQVMNPTSIHGDAGSIPGFTQWLKDLVLPWLWRTLAAAAPFQPLAWEHSCATGAALKKKKKKIAITCFLFFS